MYAMHALLSSPALGWAKICNVQYARILIGFAVWTPSFLVFYLARPTVYEFQTPYFRGAIAYLSYSPITSHFGLPTAQLQTPDLVFCSVSGWTVEVWLGMWLSYPCIRLF